MLGSPIDPSSVPTAATAVGLAAADVAIFDFISHSEMHHAFNEAYLRTVRAAFPRERIVFHAGEGHIARLAPRISDIEGIELKSCPTFTVPFGLSRHNPIGGRWAARRCLGTMGRAIAGRTTRLASLLGVDANLFAVVGRHWPAHSAAPLHMILHGQLGDAMIWRSQNPLIRAGDFVAQLRRPLPLSVRLIALELGVRDAIADIAPRLAASVATLEHPILPSEWGQAAPSRDEPGIRIAFLGHARRSKGFHDFVTMARQCARPDLSFAAIGLASPDTVELDMAALCRRPSPEGLSRRDYLEAVAEIDLVCLPLHSRAYDFTASGTLSDAIAALKPILAPRNRTLDAIVARYGPIGYIVDTADDLIPFVRAFDAAAFRQRKPEWIANLARIRAARLPENVAPGYAALVRPPEDAVRPSSAVPR